MDFKEAKEYARKQGYKANTVHITSDGSVYLNGDIEAIKKHAKKEELEIHYIKPEKIKK